MRWPGWWVAALATAGCGANEAPELWRVDLAGHAVGVERRHVQPWGWRSEREYRLVVDGQERTVTASSEWRVQDGRVVAWSSGASHFDANGEGPWQWGAAVPTGRQSVFDPATASARWGEVTERSGRLWFTSDTTRWWATFDDGQAVSLGSDAVSMHRVTTAPTVDRPVDPAHVLSLAAVGERPTARGWSLARLNLSGPVSGVVDTLDDGTVQVVRPLWLEIPEGPTLEPASHDTREPVARWVREYTGRSLRDTVEGLATQIPQEVAYEGLPDVDATAAMHGMSGNCADHARLFAEVLGALGQQAQVRVGWRYRDGRWVPHAWARVAFEGVGWVDVDPTDGQRIAGPLYLALSDASQVRPWEAMGAAAGSEVQVLELR